MRYFPEYCGWRIVFRRRRGALVVANSAPPSDSDRRSLSRFSSVPRRSRRGERMGDAQSTASFIYNCSTSCRATSSRSLQPRLTDPGCGGIEVREIIERPADGHLDQLCCPAEQTVSRADYVALAHPQPRQVSPHHRAVVKNPCFRRSPPRLAQVPRGRAVAARVAPVSALISRWRASSSSSCRAVRRGDVQPWCPISWPRPRPCAIRPGTFPGCARGRVLLALHRYFARVSIRGNRHRAELAGETAWGSRARAR
jgi:hypothetical protein